MRIAFFTHVHNFYGANRSLFTLMQALEELKISSHVLLPSHGPFIGILQRSSIPYTIFPYRAWMLPRSSWSKRLGHRLGREVQNRRLLPCLIHLLQKERIDIVHTNTAALCLGLQAARATGLPHVWHLREFGDADYHLQFDCGRECGRRIILGSDGVIAISKSIYDYYGCATSRGRAEVVYNPVHRPESDGQQLSPISPESERFRFLCVGHFNPNKRQDLSIRGLACALRQGLNAELHLVGGGQAQYIAECRELSGHLGVGDRVVFHGHVDNPDPFYHAADVCVVCSRHEAFGRVTVEAMLAGLPVIGFDAAGTAEIIEHEVSGLLFSGGEDQLAKAMVSLAASPSRASHLSQNGQAVARERFSPQGHAQQVVTLYRKLLSGDLASCPAR